MKPQAPTRPVVLIFMGVSGSGKSTVAQLFAQATGAVFYEGDDFHPPENIARLRAGISLTDADRKPWLAGLRQIIDQALVKNELSVLTCSALKAAYRDALAAGDSRVKFVHLAGPPEVIAGRLKNRHDHFMSPALLASQFAILEPPADALTFSCQLSPEQIVAELIQALAVAG